MITIEEPSRIEMQQTDQLHAEAYLYGEDDGAIVAYQIDKYRKSISIVKQYV